MRHQETSPRDYVMNEKVVIVIPTYNEEEVIANTVRQVFAATQLLDQYSIHILIFDSASQDRTQSIVKSLQEDYPNLHLQTELKKTGLGSAYMQAMRYALHQLAADIIFEFDADLSHQPSYIPGMLKTLEQADVVVGSRYIAGGSIPQNWGWHRKLLSILGNYVARIVLTPRYKDFTSGFRATRRHLLMAHLPKKFLSNGYAYKLHLLWILHQSKAQIREFPIEFIDREQGLSKLPRATILHSLAVVLFLRLTEMKKFLKMCVIGSAGLLIQLCLYNLLRVHIPPFNAAQIAVSTAVVHNYFLNNSFTFKQSKVKRRYQAKRFFLFFSYSILMIYLQSYWLKWCLSYVGGGKMHENIIIILGVIFAAILNYIVYSRKIWAKFSFQ